MQKANRVSSVIIFHLWLTVMRSNINRRRKKSPHSDVHRMENLFYHSIARTKCLVSLHSLSQSHQTCWLSTQHHWISTFHQSHHTFQKVTSKNDGNFERKGFIVLQSQSPIPSQQELKNFTIERTTAKVQNTHADPVIERNEKNWLRKRTWKHSQHPIMFNTAFVFSDSVFFFFFLFFSWNENMIISQSIQLMGKTCQNCWGHSSSPANFPWKCIRSFDEKNGRFD